MDFLGLRYVFFFFFSCLSWSIGCGGVLLFDAVSSDLIKFKFFFFWMVLIGESREPGIERCGLCLALMFLSVFAVFVFDFVRGSCLML